MEDVIPILEFDPLDEVFQLGSSMVGKAIKRRLDQELLEFVERRIVRNDERARKNMGAEEPISVVEQTRIEVEDVWRDQEEDDSNGDFELELMAKDELF